MSSTVGDEGQGGQFGGKEVRTCRLPFAAIFRVLTPKGQNPSESVLVYYY